ncbi:hypothetical protein AAE478_006738 [Parahypoxylon ruwenzoriense]
MVKKGVLPPSALRLSANCWFNACGDVVKGVWVFTLPTTEGQPNTWKIALELETGKIITLELYETNSLSGQVILMRSINDNIDTPGGNDFATLDQMKVALHGRRMKDRVTVRDVIEKIQASGLVRYRLKDGRGHRHWIYSVLSQIQPWIHEPRKWGHLIEETNNSMRNCWLAGGRRLTSFGYEDEKDNPLTIKPGEFIATAAKVTDAQV